MKTGIPLSGPGEGQPSKVELSDNKLLFQQNTRKNPQPSTPSTKAKRAALTCRFCCLPRCCPGRLSGERDFACPLRLMSHPLPHLVSLRALGFHRTRVSLGPPAPPLGVTTGLSGQPGLPPQPNGPEPVPPAPHSNFIRGLLKQGLNENQSLVTQYSRNTPDRVCLNRNRELL